MKKTLLRGALCATILGITSISSHAAPVTFTDRASFDAAAGSLGGFESFEADFVGAATVSFTDFTVTEIDDISNYVSFSTTEATDGSRSLEVLTSSDSSTTVYQFSSPINAFGFDIRDDAYINTFFNVAIDDVSIGGFTYTGTDSGAFAFWGVIDTAGTFSKLSFTPTGVSSNLLMDSVSYGTSAVPLPSAVWLFGSGMLGLLGIVRRKKAN